MADFVNPSTLQLVPSENSMPDPWVVITRAQFLDWSVIPQHFRKWVTDHVEEMTGPEQADALAALLEAQRDAETSRVDNVEDALRATVLVLRDELNAHADKINSILTAVDNAASFGAMKTAIAAIADYPQRTIANVRNSIRGKLGT